MYIRLARIRFLNSTGEYLKQFDCSCSPYYSHPHSLKFARLFSTSTTALCSKKKKYYSTILFPKINFPRNPIKKKRRDNEITVEELTSFSSLYSIQEKRNNCESFVLHDGPPYANDKLHIGHALNKILKDIINRYKLMRGYKVDYQPGWDCHGLPIELKAMERERKSNKLDWHSLTPIEIREKASALAEEALELQKNTFQQWGLLADWNKIYTTKDRSYISKELKLFAKLYEDGYIFQAYMPVNYSPSSETTLAETELEYKNHESPSLYLGFRAKELSPEMKNALNISDSNLYLPIWTTTPWTLPGNLAICVSPEKEYALVQTTFKEESIKFLWIVDNLDSIPEVLNINSYKVVKKIQGNQLSGIPYFNPFNNKNCQVFSSSHVTTSKGTGLVHTAPAHGKEDFLVALKYNLRTDFQLVDEKGCFTSIAGDDLKGKKIFLEGNDIIHNHIKKFEDDQSLVLFNWGKILHSYPYDWRTKEPTLMRASKQWFFNIEKIQEQILDALNKITIYPSYHRERFLRILCERPYWCISRQRSWGVPIPVFYDSQTQEPITNREVIEHIANIIEKDGPNAWWTLPEETLLPSDFVASLKDQNKPIPIKGKDILDIWFDAGASWHCVLNGKKADFYVEGVDQLSGWFQSSFLTSVAATGEAPFNKLYIHDFVVDEHFKKMSKSVGNVVDPSVITDGGNDLVKDPVYGVNGLRWWVASQSHAKKIPIGKEILKECEINIVQLRVLFWYLLTNLKDFNEDNLVQFTALWPLDKYFLSRLRTTVFKTTVPGRR